MQLLLQVIREAGDVARVLADREGRHHVVERGLHRISTAVAEGLTPADQAGVGLDPHQQDIVGRPGTQAFAFMAAPEGVRHLDRLAVDARDLHSMRPLRLMSASSAVA